MNFLKNILNFQVKRVLKVLIKSVATLLVEKFLKEEKFQSEKSCQIWL